MNTPLLCPAALRRAVLLCSLSALAAPALALQTPLYRAAIEVTPDVFTPGDTLNAGKLPWQDLTRAPQLPTDTTVRLTHTSFQGTGTIGNASATAEHGGTVRATASTADEQIGSYASIYYEFQLEAKPGAVLPSSIPLRVQALGSVGSEGYATADITFAMGYRSVPRGPVSSIFQTTGVVSGVGQEPVITNGNGSIYIDEWAQIAPYTPVTVALSAHAGAGLDVRGQDPYKNHYGTGSAWVDPVFTVAPEYRGLVNIVGVPVSAVPEPATWVMSLVGLGSWLLRPRPRAMRA